MIKQSVSSKWMKRQVIDRTLYTPWSQNLEKGEHERVLYDEVEQLLIKLGIWSRKEDKMLRKKGQSKKALLKAALNPGRVQLLEAAEEKIFKQLPQIVEKACDLALAGDINAMRLILDRTMPTFKQKEERTEGAKSGITINITGTKFLEGHVKDAEAIDGEFTESETPLKRFTEQQLKEIEHVK
jgi:hypothetical protein